MGMTAPLELDEKFAFITTMRSYYENHIPFLNLGTVLKKEPSDYWVCIQPRCDCVRITSTRVFPFLPLTSTESGKKFRFVLQDNGQHIRMSLSEKLYQVKLLEFSSNGKSAINAENKEGHYYFRDTNNNEYKWLGELRTDQSQRLVHQFATAVSRIGLNESEWLRLWAERG